MTSLKRLVIAGAIAACGAMAAAPAAAQSLPTLQQLQALAAALLAQLQGATGAGGITVGAGSGMQLVDRGISLPGQTVRLNVALPAVGPSHCRMTLIIIDRLGQRVSSSGPIRVTAGASASVELTGVALFRAMLDAGDPRCRKVADATVEVF